MSLDQIPRTTDEHLETRSEDTALLDPNYVERLLIVDEVEQAILIATLARFGITAHNETPRSFIHHWLATKNVAYD